MICLSGKLRLLSSLICISHMQKAKGSGAENIISISNH